MGDDYEISEVKSDWAAACVYSEDEAAEAYADMKEHFPYAGIARIMADGHEWYVMGSTEPLQLRVRPDESVHTSTVDDLEAAISYLADVHMIHLYRVNTQGWAFVKKGHVSKDVEGATIEDAVIFHIERIQRENREQQRRTQEALERTMNMATTCDTFLERIAGPQKDVDDEQPLP